MPVTKSANKPTIYLGGSINGLNPDEVLEKFDMVQEGLEFLGFEVLSPTRGKKVSRRKGEFVGYEPNEIVHRDLRDIDNADYMLALFEVPGIGTSMEIIYARLTMNIPVIVVSTDPRVTEHYWIKSLASKILPDIESAYIYLKEWYL